MTTSPYDALPLWDGVSPLPDPVPTSPYTRDAAGRWRVRGRFARLRTIGAQSELGFILRQVYADIWSKASLAITPMLAHLTRGDA